ncbi:MAG: serine/threonine-protein kinase, partial [Planctomycetota bacterium]|nr:serine/threonine-protein kinase [Planctomycetota bacterium]
LRHPNIVTVHDVGHEEGRDYLVMDLVEGVTLGEALRQRQFTYREKAALLEKVARAVQYAHDHGVIHRDLKPGNIMLDYGRGGSPTLHGSGSNPLSQAPTEAPLSQAASVPQAAKPVDVSERSGSSSLVPDVSKVVPAFFEPLVMDFGLAKNTQPESGLSRTGQALGTPAYMAPEQAEGKAP